MTLTVATAMLSVNTYTLTVATATLSINILASAKRVVLTF